MSNFPIFVDVASRPPLVVGGAELATAKVRLLTKRAPRVDVLTDSPGPAMQRLADDGHATLFADTPTIAHIRGRPLVIAAGDDDALNADVYAIAKR